MFGIGPLQKTPSESDAGLVQSGVSRPSADRFQVRIPRALSVPAAPSAQQLRLPSRDSSENRCGIQAALGIGDALGSMKHHFKPTDRTLKEALDVFEGIFRDMIRFEQLDYAHRSIGLDTIEIVKFEPSQRFTARFYIMDTCVPNRNTWACKATKDSRRYQDVCDFGAMLTALNVHQYIHGWCEKSRFQPDMLPQTLLQATHEMFEQIQKQIALMVTSKNKEEEARLFMCEHLPGHLQRCQEILRYTLT